jgi:hypothetical protein
MHGIMKQRNTQALNLPLEISIRSDMYVALVTPYCHQKYENKKHILK